MILCWRRWLPLEICFMIKRYVTNRHTSCLSHPISSPNCCCSEEIPRSMRCRRHGTLALPPLQQVVADLRSAVALGKDCVMTQFEALQKDVKVVKKKFQCVVLEKERASVVAMQVLEDQFKDKFEVKRYRGWIWLYRYYAIAIHFLYSVVIPSACFISSIMYQHLCRVEGLAN